MTAMTKKEFAARLKELLDAMFDAKSRKECGLIYEAVCATVGELLTEGRSVCLPGIGTLKPVTLPPLERFCALTGEVESAPARRSVKFRPSMMVKRELNKEAKK